MKVEPVDRGEKLTGTTEEVVSHLCHRIADALNAAGLGPHPILVIAMAHMVGDAAKGCAEECGLDPEVIQMIVQKTSTGAEFDAEDERRVIVELGKAAQVGGGGMVARNRETGETITNTLPDGAERLMLRAAKTDVVH